MLITVCLSFAALGTGLVWHQCCSQEIKISLLPGTVSSASGHRSADPFFSAALLCGFWYRESFVMISARYMSLSSHYLSFLIALLDFWQSYSSIKLDCLSLHVAFFCCPASFPCLPSPLSFTLSSFSLSIPHLFSLIPAFMLKIHLYHSACISIPSLSNLTFILSFTSTENSEFHP